jgi:hypothetical protein
VGSELTNAYQVFISVFDTQNCFYIAGREATGKGGGCLSLSQKVLILPVRWLLDALNGRNCHLMTQRL